MLPARPVFTRERLITCCHALPDVRQLQPPVSGWAARYCNVHGCRGCRRPACFHHSRHSNLSRGDVCLTPAMSSTVHWSAKSHCLRCVLRQVRNALVGSGGGRPRSPWTQCVWALVCAVPAVVCVLGYDQLQLGFVQAAVSEFALLSGAAFVGAIGAGIVFDGVGGLSATLGAAVGHAVGTSAMLLSRWCACAHLGVVLCPAAVAGVALNQHAAADKSGVPSPELALVVAAAAAVPPLAALAGAACCQVLGFASSGVPARRPQPLQRALTLSSVLGTRAHVQARVLPLLSLCCWPAPSTAPRYALVGRPCDEGVWMRDVELAPLQAGSRGSHAGSVTSVASVASDSAGLRLQSTTTASENAAAQSHVAPTMDQHPLAAMEVDERGSTPSTGIRASTEDSMVTAAASPPPASVDSDDDGSERVATESPRMVGASTSAAGWKGREDRRADSDSQHTITTSVRTAAYVAVFSYWLPMLVVVPGCVAAMVWLW